MANTYHQIYIQAVFAVKYRNALINRSNEQYIFGILGTLIADIGCKPIIVNGDSDHVHCFMGVRPSISISDLMRSIKSRSSKQINENRITPLHFEWQEGYGAFSYSHSHIEQVYKYILDQKKHHQSESFKEEYLNILNKFEIPYEERYLFEELI